MNAKKAAELIMTESEKVNDEHYMIGTGAGHYYGGSEHNDDRLTATVKDGLVTVSDGNDYQTIDPEDYTPAELRKWVRDYMERGWEAE